MLKGMLNLEGCTKDAADDKYDDEMTDFAKRVRRLHVMSYAHRVFAEPGATEYDAPSHQPQYIGRDEGALQYRLKGMFLPADEEGIDYYLQRRLENSHPGITGLPSLYKSMPDAASSPSRWTSRSKLGAAFLPRRIRQSPALPAQARAEQNRASRRSSTRDMLRARSLPM